jgi:hypothetical protein
MLESLLRGEYLNLMKDFHREMACGACRLSGERVFRTFPKDFYMGLQNSLLNVFSRPVFCLGVNYVNNPTIHLLRH